MKKQFLKIIPIILALTIGFSACKKKKTEEDFEDMMPHVKLYTLVIANGAMSVPQGKSLPFTAYLVDEFGVETIPASVTWSVSSASAGSFAGNIFTAMGDEPAIITAKTTVQGIEYNASVPLAIAEPNSIFTVVPSAIIWATNAGNIDLHPVYFGTGAASSSFSYTSSNSGVASVNSTGSVSFNSVGNANITVTGSINGQTAKFIVPVMVVGEPSVPLPVARVVVTPAQEELFRGETKQFVARAYDSGGKDVTSTVTFEWTVASKDPEFPMPVSINNSGLLTVNSIGDAFVYATAKGIKGQAEVAVLPDSLLIIDPFHTSLGGIDPFTGATRPNEQTFTATAYRINRAKYRNKDSNFFETINLPAIKWSLPEAGIPQIDDQFKVVTLSNATNNSVKATAIDNKFGSTIIIATAIDYPELEGASMITVGF